SASYASFFFFQAEDGIRDDLVTGVQTCALPISLVEPPVFASSAAARTPYSGWDGRGRGDLCPDPCRRPCGRPDHAGAQIGPQGRSEERRVGKGCRSRVWRDLSEQEVRDTSSMWK